MEPSLILVCYFDEFLKNENDRRTWYWTSNREGVFALHLMMGVSYTDIYHDVQNLINMDPSQYEMDLDFIFSTIQISRLAN